MNNKTRQTIFFSVLAVILCVAVSIGVTYAFFTDSISDKSNKVQSGRLKVDLEVLEKGTTDSWYSIKKDKAPIFADRLWESGYTDVKILRVRNDGTLAIGWEARYVSETALTALSDVIDVYIVKSADPIAYPTAREELGNWGEPITLTAFVNDISSILKGTLAAGESAYFGIALRMKSGIGDQYQGMTLGEFDIKILASQVNSETDAFGPDYDKDAPYPCDHSQIRVISGIPATCTQDGISNGKVCSLCEETLVEQKTIFAFGHNEVVDAAVEPTYTSTGLTEGKHCSECSEVFVAQQTIPMLSPFVFEKSENEESYVIIGLKNDVPFTDVEIPATHEGLPVGAIGASAFGGSNITSVKIPGTVHTISNSAFENCASLNTITFAGNETQWNAVQKGSARNDGIPATYVACTDANVCFEGEYLSSDWIVVSEASYTAEGYRYKKCTVCEEILEEETSPIPSPYVIEDNGDGTVIITNYASEANTTVLEIPATINGMTVTEIAAQAFAEHPTLSTVIFTDNSVTTIGLMAFAGCENLQTVELPNGLLTIGSGAFYKSGLVKITIPVSVTTIADQAFKTVTTLTEIYYEGSIAQWQSISFGGAWDHNTGDYVIYCTNGQIAKDGTITMYT